MGDCYYSWLIWVAVFFAILWFQCRERLMGDCYWNELGKGRGPDGTGFSAANG